MKKLFLILFVIAGIYGVLHYNGLRTKLRGGMPEIEATSQSPTPIAQVCPYQSPQLCSADEVVKLTELPERISDLSPMNYEKDVDKLSKLSCWSNIKDSLQHLMDEEKGLQAREAMVQEYASQFSENELRENIEFLKSNLGKKYLSYIKENKQDFTSAEIKSLEPVHDKYTQRHQKIFRKFGDRHFKKISDILDAHMSKDGKCKNNQH